MSFLTWQTLPWHIIVEIYSNLEIKDRIQARLACKSWSECFHDRKLWSRFTVILDTHKDEDASALNLFYQHINQIDLVSVSINQSQILSRNRAVQLLNVCTNKLHNLSGLVVCFHGCNPQFYKDQELVQSIKTLLSRFKDCNNFQSCLTYVNLNKFQLTLNDSLIYSIFNGHKNLKKVCIQNDCLVDNVSVRSILDLVEMCPNLEELHTFYHSVDNSVIDALSVPTRNAIFKYLSLRCNRSDKFGNIITSESWQRLKFFQQKLEVEMYFHQLFPLHLVKLVLVENIPLVKLNLRMFAWINDELLHLSNFYGHHLKILSFSTNVDQRASAPPGLDEVLVMLVEKCYKLVNIYCFCSLKSETIIEIKRIRSLDSAILYTYETYDSVITQKT